VAQVLARFQLEVSAPGKPFRSDQQPGQIHQLGLSFGFAPPRSSPSMTSGGACRGSPWRRPGLRIVIGSPCHAPCHCGLIANSGIDGRPRGVRGFVGWRACLAPWGRPSGTRPASGEIRRPAPAAWLAKAPVALAGWSTS